MVGTSRRDFIKGGLAGTGVISIALYAWSRQRSHRQGIGLAESMGPLQVVADETTGLPLLCLPEGFRYRTLSWAGSQLHDGHTVPGSADGMGVVQQLGSRVTLVRNHELQGSSGPMGDPANAYDNTGGGTTTLVFDTVEERLVDSRVSLGGTLFNCAGGVTPWGSWLSCEEAVFSPALLHLPRPQRQLLWDVAEAQREHGFVFEVPAEGVATPEPIHAMGQFYHEAAAVDPATGIVYLTEDSAPSAGFYRFVPDQPGRLRAGGKLQMMRVYSRPDMTAALKLGEEMDTGWVDIARPTKGFTAGNRRGDGVVSQGLAAGGSRFLSLEGCAFAEGHVWFTSKAGGTAAAGYILEYDPVREKIWMVYESPGNESFSGPDNITLSPRGSLVVCEDRVSLRKKAQFVAGLSRTGEFFRFCRVNPDLRGQFNGHDLADTALVSEWAGATFSHDGQWLFLNLYSPGVTIAITGHWQEGFI